MDFRNLIFQSIVVGLVLLAYQRTEKKRRIWVGLLLTLPATYLLWRIAIFNDHLTEFLIGSVLALVLNLIFWLAFGRSHPPGYKGDIIVISPEDE